MKLACDYLMPADVATPSCLTCSNLPHLLLNSCLLLTWAGQGPTAADAGSCTPVAGNSFQLDPPAASPPAFSAYRPARLCRLQGRASSDHTTLLLNCYTKLKNLSKLDSFLKGDGSDDGTPLLNFDVDTAVKAGPWLNETYT